MIIQAIAHSSIFLRYTFLSSFDSSKKICLVHKNRKLVIRKVSYHVLHVNQIFSDLLLMIQIFYNLMASSCIERVIRCFSNNDELTASRCITK